MWRLINIALIFILLLVIPALSQILTLGSGAALKGTPPPFQGPGDVVAGASMWWGLRAYNAAYAMGSNPAADICDVSTGLTCTTINILANGSFDAATAQASASCAVACNVSKLYDQTGNGNHITQSTNANRPTLVFNCIGSLPCIQSTSSSIVLNTATFTPATGVVSLSTVGNRAAGTGVFLAVNEAGTGQTGNRIRGGTANLWNLTAGAAGGFTATANDAAWHSANAVVNGASSVLNIDGTETTGTVAGVTTAGGNVAFRSNTSTTFNETESGIWDNVTFTGTQRTNLCHNQFAYWGTSTSC